MIPSTTNRLLVAEDWTKIYQTFRNADFKSYDFETLRRTMINYLRENYPEEFNDYVDSSEFIALVDLIAFLGQNLSFRIDLNARENFLETAQRRDSILRLARLINYNAKRNVPANGFLKITSVSTTENVIDSNGINLSNSIIGWNDTTNSNWYQQFLSIMNAAMISPTTFGKPVAAAVIDGISTEQYKLNTSSTDVPVYTFSKNVGGTQMSFELVSSTFSGQTYIYEEPPKPAAQFGIMFKNDNKGSSSANTGFFVHFRQGSLSASNFNVATPVPNEIIGVNVSGINDTDVWLWQLSADTTQHQTLWTKVPAVTGNNIIYNSLDISERNIYGVITRENDQVDLTFADGSFGNLPNGPFRLYYRQSNGNAYNIKPEQLNNISVQIPYISKSGQSHNLTIILSLQYTVTNSAAPESDADIKVKAPQSYYTQNRMITAEDYNITPLTINSDILKIKSTNRISSGVSKYFELSDVSGAYSKTNIFADDGILFRENAVYSFEFMFNSRNDITAMLTSQLADIINSPSFKTFYLSTDHYPRIDLTNYELNWQQSTVTTNQTTGYLKSNITSLPATVGDYSSNSLSFFKPGSLVKFIAPTGNYFLPNGTLTTTFDSTVSSYIWIKVVNIVGDGNNISTGQGPIILAGQVPSTAVPSILIPKFQNILSYAIETEILNLCLSKRNFGLSFDATTRTWYIISDSNLNLKSPFSLLAQRDISNINKDASWMVSFEWTGKHYVVRYRITNHIFESDKETAFFFDKTQKNYDFATDTIIKDQVVVLANNIIDAQSLDITIGTSNIAVTDIKALNITAISTSGSNTLQVLEGVQSNAIGTASHYAVHPNITPGTRTTAVTSINGHSIISLSANIIGAIPSSSYVTFIPTQFTATNIEPIFRLSKDYSWQIDSAIIEPDGYIEPKKVLVSFFDYNDDGQIDNPDLFEIIVNPNSVNEQTGYKDKFVYFKKSVDGQTYSLYTGKIDAYPNETANNFAPIIGNKYYFYETDVIKSWHDTGGVLEPLYYAKSGRSNIKFQYIHNSGQSRRLDPSKSNIIDVYMLTSSYDVDYRNWAISSSGVEPLPPTSQSLEENFASSLEPVKAISDEIVYQSAKYKILFGSKALPQLQATFKAVKNAARTVSDTDIQTRILSTIQDFFILDNWEFGQTFNFGELATYVMNIMSPDITNFVIVPKMDNSFGSLYQITCASNEIFISGATVNDIQVITSLTASELKATSTIVTNS